MDDSTQGAKADQPLFGRLPGPVGQDTLLEAVRRSGYPLQTLTALELQRAGFVTTEEWGFTDPQLKKHRSLDIRAVRASEDRGKAAVAPFIVIYVECKRSQHPWLLFQAVTEAWRSHYPVVGFHKQIELRCHNRERNSYRLLKPSIASLLGIPVDAYVNAAPFASSFARAEVNGKKIDRISGDHMFNDVIRPVLDATRFGHIEMFQGFRGVTPTPSPGLEVSLIVFDGPLFLVDSRADDPQLSPIPWGRVFRHDSVDPSQAWKQPAVRVVDIVHQSHLREFLSDQLMPLFSQVEQSSRTHSKILDSDYCEATSIDSWSPTSLRPMKTSRP